MRVHLSPCSPGKSLLPVILTLLMSMLARGANPAERVDLGDGLAIEIVRIEPGSFQQGSPATETQRRSDETPRAVTLTQAFWLGKYPVTRGQFARFVEETRYRTEAEVGTSGGFGWEGGKLTQRKDFTWMNPGFPQTDAHPVTIVTYKDARAFLVWLSRKSGRVFSLPSEAQWEYACRAGTTAAFAPGSESRTNAGAGTQPVGQTAPNAWGLGDMTGNVWQWCEDWFAPYAGGTATDPLQTESTLSDKPRRVLRGGSWLRSAADLRSAARYRNDAASRNADNGFRVMTLDAAPSTPPAHPLPKPTPERPGLIARPEASTNDRIVPSILPDAAPRHSTHANDVPPPSGHGFPLRGFLFAAVVVLVILAVIVAVIRGITKNGATGVMPGNLGSSGGSGPLRTRIVDDGFWIESTSLPAGTVLECRYSAGGKQNHSSVTFQGGAGGQFVFTGSRPSSVSVAVLPGGGPSISDDIGGSAFGRAAGMMTGLHQSPPLSDDDDRTRSRSHPPAY